MRRRIEGWLVDNYLTPNNTHDKILMIKSAGHLTLSDVIGLMLKEDTGLRRETLEHAVNLYHRVVGDQVLNGFSVNTGLFRAVPQFRGIVENGQWNPEKNSIHVSFVQDKDLREAIAETLVEILGEKADSMYIVGGEDPVTRATDGTATAGRNYILHGRQIKVAGKHESVGVTLTDDSGKVIKITPDMVPLNNPAQLMLLLPADLPDGNYTVTVTTQFSGSSTLLKSPRYATTTIYVGQTPETPGGGSGGSGGDDNDGDGGYYVDPNT